MTSVRGFDEKDRDEIEKLCIENTGASAAGEDTRKYISLTKCCYYLECEPDNCFVAEDDNDGVIGCILCAENIDKYENIFNEKYIPQVAALGAKRYVEAKLSLLPVTMYRKYYSTHFIIYLKSSWYGVGVGELLLTALKNKLKEKNISSLLTVCDSNNEDHIAYFENTGFEKLISTKYGTVLAIKIND